MFTQTFALACIASIASANQLAQNKIAEIKSNLAQTSSSQVQTFGLAQKLAESATTATNDGGNGNAAIPPSAELLAQIEQTSGHTCHSSLDRNKAPLVDFYSIYQGSTMYTDADFAPNNDALYWADMGEDMSSKASRITWTRASSAFPNLTLFGADGVHADDIQKGNIHNDWLLAACASMAQIPGAVEKMFLNSANEISPNGIYAVNLYALGMPITVIVDDYLPLQHDGGTYFAGLGDNESRGDEGSLWGPIIEKAFAKFYGNYSHIVNGQAFNAVNTMHNAPAEPIVHDHSDSAASAANLQKLKSHLDQGHILMAQALSKRAEGSCCFNEFGLTAALFHNVLGYVTLSDGTDLIKMQDPYGDEYYTGDWSDSSSKWDEVPNAREDAGWVERNDGVFFMSYDDYWSQLFGTFYSYDTTDWSSASFLMLDDSTAGEDGQAEHNLTLTSSVAQKIYLTVHTWEERHMPNMYLKPIHNNEGGYHTCQGNMFRQGWQLEYDIEANTPFTVRTTWDWSDERRAKDWSVVAFGAEGTLTLTLDGYESDVMPVLDGTHDDQKSYEQQLEDFFNWAENYEVETKQEGMLHWNEAGTCGHTISDEWVDDGTGRNVGYYRTVIKNTCVNDSMLVTVYMEEDAWDRIQHFYERIDGDGKRQRGTVILPETKYDEDGLLGKTFRVGWIDHPENFGVEAFNREQTIAAWEGGLGDKAFSYYATTHDPW